MWLLMVFLLLQLLGTAQQTCCQSDRSKVENTMKLWLQYAADHGGGDMPGRLHDHWLQTVIEQTLLFLIKLMYACVRFSDTVSSVQASVLVNCFSVHSSAFWDG